MKDSQIRKLMSITARLETLVLKFEDKSKRDLEQELSSIYSNMVEFVGAELLSKDEIGGVIE